MPLINCEIELIFDFSNISNVKPAVNISATSAKFQITATKLYVSVVTLWAENDKKFLEQLRAVFKRTNKCNKYRSEMTNQTKNNNLNHLIDPTFTKFNRLFVWKWKR